jgi:LAS superfamily LD-carboxypeptidase LdcB
MSTSNGTVVAAEEAPVPATADVQHWAYQVDTPFRLPAEIRELSDGNGQARSDEALADFEGVETFEGADTLAEGEDFGIDEAVDEAESSWLEAADEAPEFEVGEDEAPFAEVTPADHPLAAVFTLPRLAFDALAKGGWLAAIAIAIGAGYRDVNQLTNMVFWFRHPQLIGQKLQSGQRDLIREWIDIRDNIVKRALAGAASATPSAPTIPSPRPAPSTAPSGITSIPSSNLEWPGASDEQLRFMRAVYDAQVAGSKKSGPFVADLPDDQMDWIDKANGHRLRADAAAFAISMMKAAQAELVAKNLVGSVRFAVLSAYRPATLQFIIWQGKGRKGGFPAYYKETEDARVATGNPHGPAAVQVLVHRIRKMVAAPGYSNHQDGTAIDFGTRKGPGKLLKVYEGSWFHNWLKTNAKNFNFHPLSGEAWHWYFIPPKPGTASEIWEASPELEAWPSSEGETPAIRGDKLEVPRIRLLASHDGNPPDLILHWNDMPAVPAEIDVVIHLHGYSWASMKLQKHIEVWSGLDLAPVDGATGSGRSRPTLTVLPRGHNTGVPMPNSKLYKYTFPALTTKDGLTNLVKLALEEFARKVHGNPPKVARLILTAHSGGGAPLMRVLGHDPQEVHAYDALYQDATALGEWASRHIKADLKAVREGAAPTGAMRVFYRPSTRKFSERLLKQIASDLEGAPASVRDRYRVEASTLGHWQIPRQYGWRMLADPSADVPNAHRPSWDEPAVSRLYESEESEADEGTEEWQLEQAAMEAEAATAEFEDPEAGEAELEEPEAGEELETEGQALGEAEADELEEPEADPEFEELDAEAVLHAAEGRPAFEELDAEAVLSAAEAGGAFESESEIDMGGELDGPTSAEALSERLATVDDSEAFIGGAGISSQWEPAAETNSVDGAGWAGEAPRGGLTEDFLPDVSTLSEVSMALPTTSPAKEKCKAAWRAKVAALPAPIRDVVETEADLTMADALPLVQRAIDLGSRDVSLLTNFAYFAIYGQRRGYCPIARGQTNELRDWLYLQNEVKTRLARLTLVPSQAGPVTCVGPRENRIASPKPDVAPAGLTGRYEYEAAGQPRPNGGALAVNQAGQHLEVSLAPFEVPGGPRGRTVRFYRCDLDKSGAFIAVNRENAQDRLVLTPAAGEISLAFEGGPPFATARRIESRATIFPEALVSIGESVDPNPPRRGSIRDLIDRARRSISTKSVAPFLFLREHQPLARYQEAFLRERFRSVEWTNLLRSAVAATGDRAADKARREGLQTSIEAFVNRVINDPQRGVHKSDYTLAFLVVRQTLSSTGFTYGGRRQSTLDWLQMLAQLTGQPIAADTVIGVRPLPRTVDRYEYAVSLDIAEAAFFIGGGVGKMIVRQTKPTPWAKAIELRVWFGSVGGSVKLGTDSFSGTATSALPWTERDFIGRVERVKGGADVSVPGVSVGVSAGFLHIYGSEALPPLQVLDRGVDWSSVIEFDKGDEPGPKRWGVKGGVGFSLGGHGLVGTAREIGQLRVRDVTTIRTETLYGVTGGGERTAHFCFDSALLTPAARQGLRIAAALWRPYLSDSRSSLSITGYADKAGSDRYNQTLSENRAKNAFTALRDILGADLAASKVSVVGLGESQATAGGVRAGAKDRRVEVKLNGLTVLSMFSQ